MRAVFSNISSNMFWFQWGCGIENTSVFSSFFKISFTKSDNLDLDSKNIDTSFSMLCRKPDNSIFLAQKSSCCSQRVIFFFLLLFLSAQIYSQGFNEQIYNAYISGNMEQWKEVMNEMQSTIDLVKSEDLTYDLVIAQYGYIGFKINAGEKDEAKKYIRFIEDNLDFLENTYPDPAKIHAIRGAVQGYKVGLNAYKALFFGRKAFTENNVAMELSPDDPQVWMEKGNIELFKPEIFNPDSREAAKIYSKSIRLYEADRANLKYNWLYLNTLINLATAHITSGDYAAANLVYEKLLKHEPALKWVKDEVYPAFKRKHGF